MKDFPGSMPAGESLWHGAGEVFRAWRPAKDFKDFPCSWLHAEDFKDFRQRKSLKSSAWSWRPKNQILIVLGSAKLEALFFILNRKA
jgi:hypothetical protein